MKKIFPVCLFLALPLNAPTPSLAGPRAQRTVLNNGLALLTSDQRNLPMVTLELLIKAGSRYDPAGQEGIANLTSRLLTYGTRQRSALQISEELDFIGARLRTRCRNNQVTVNLTLLKKDLDVGLHLFAEILTDSIFPPNEIQRLKNSVVAAIQSKRENARAIARETFIATLYPDSPHGRPVEGSEGSVTTIDRSHIKSFFQNYYRPNRSILAVVGDVTREEIEEKLNQSMKGWKKGSHPTDSPIAMHLALATTIRVDRHLTQPNIMVSHTGISRGHPDYYAVYVMNHILGDGGLSSRLVHAIRIKRSFGLLRPQPIRRGKRDGNISREDADKKRDRPGSPGGRPKGNRTDSGAGS